MENVTTIPLKRILHAPFLIINAWALVLSSPVEERTLSKNSDYSSNVVEFMRKEVRSIMYWVTGILGFVLAVAPWLFNFSNNPTALWTSVLVGLATVGFSFWEGTQAGKEAWEYWTVGILGVVAIIAPFILGFGSHASAMWSSVIMGVLIALFAGGRLTTGFKST